jgi:hypothetical protein
MSSCRWYRTTCYASKTRVYYCGSLSVIGVLQEFFENANARGIFFEKTAKASSKGFSNIEVFRHFAWGGFCEEKKKKKKRRKVNSDVAGFRDKEV